MSLAAAGVESIADARSTPDSSEGSLEGACTIQVNGEPLMVKHVR